MVKMTKAVEFLVRPGDATMEELCVEFEATTVSGDKVCCPDGINGMFLKLIAYKTSLWGR